LHQISFQNHQQFFISIEWGLSNTFTIYRTIRTQMTTNVIRLQKMSIVFLLDFLWKY